VTYGELATKILNSFTLCSRMGDEQEMITLIVFTTDNHHQAKY